MLPILAHSISCLTLLLAFAPAPAAAQGSEPEPRVPQWAPISLDTLTLSEQRALLAPPVYWHGAEINRAALEHGRPLWHHAVLVDWYLAGGTNASESSYFLIFPRDEGAPTVGWKGLTEAHANDNAGQVVDRVRTCLYLLSDSAFAYVAIRDPKAPRHPIWNSVPQSGVYRLGYHSNATEPQVYWSGPLPVRLGARCRADLGQRPPDP